MKTQFEYKHSELKKNKPASNKKISETKQENCYKTKLNFVLAA